MKSYAPYVLMAFELGYYMQQTYSNKYTNNMLGTKHKGNRTADTAIRF